MASCGSSFSPGRGRRVPRARVFSSPSIQCHLSPPCLPFLSVDDSSDQHGDSPEGRGRKRQSRRQRRREARFTVTGNPVHGWRRWTSLYTGMPQRPLLLKMVATGGLHPRSAAEKECIVLGDDTLCFQPIASAGGNDVAAQLKERLAREVAIGDGLLRLSFLQPPLIVRTNGMYAGYAGVRGPQAYFCDVLLSSEEQGPGAPSRSAELTFPFSSHGASAVWRMGSRPHHEPARGIE